MSTHQVKITVATVLTSFPADTSFQGVRIALGNLEPIIVASSPYEAVFYDVEAGEYPVTAQALDMNSAALGEQISTTASIFPDALNIDIPSSISVQVD